MAGRTAEARLAAEGEEELGTAAGAAHAGKAMVEDAARQERVDGAPAGGPEPVMGALVLLFMHLDERVEVIGDEPVLRRLLRPARAVEGGCRGILPRARHQVTQERMHRLRMLGGRCPTILLAMCWSRGQLQQMRSHVQRVQTDPALLASEDRLLPRGHASGYSHRAYSDRKKLRVGDQVLSQDATGKITVTTVTKTVKIVHHRGCLLINKQLRVSHLHRLMAKKDGGGNVATAVETGERLPWIEARTLEVGDQLRTIDGVVALGSSSRCAATRRDAFT